jgi:hypothetical protein
MATADAILSREVAAIDDPICRDGLPFLETADITEGVAPASRAALALPADTAASQFPAPVRIEKAAPAALALGTADGVVAAFLRLLARLVVRTAADVGAG